MTIKTTELIRTSQSWDGVQLPDFPLGKPEMRVIRLAPGERIEKEHTYRRRYE